jgi:hypothetical protein
LNEKLSKQVKTKIQERIKLIEGCPPVVRVNHPQHVLNPPYGYPSSTQAPSTQKILNDIESATATTIGIAPQQPTTFAAAQALSERTKAMQSAGKIEPGRTSARKF